MKAKQVCWSSLLSSRNVRWPRRMLPPGESQWVCRRDRRVGRQTDARPLHYAFRYRRVIRKWSKIWGPIVVGSNSNSCLGSRQP